MVNNSHSEIKNVLVVQVHMENAEPCPQRWKKLFFTVIIQIMST